MYQKHKDFTLIPSIKRRESRVLDLFFPNLKNTQFDPNSTFNLQIGHEFMEIDTPIDDSLTNPHSIWWFGGLIWWFELRTHKNTQEHNLGIFGFLKGLIGISLSSNLRRYCSWKLRLLVARHLDWTFTTQQEQFLVLYTQSMGSNGKDERDTAGGFPPDYTFHLFT